MATMQVHSQSQPVSAAVLQAKSTARMKPVKWWAALGATHCCFAALVLVRWILSGDMHRTHPGPDVAPDHVLIAVRVAEIGSPIIAVLFFYRYLVKPWRREGHITVDGMLLIGCLSLYFPYDIFNDYATYLIQYNS